MADILERVPNPALRSVLSALMGASATTIAVGGLLGLTDLDNRLVHRAGVYGAAAGAIAGAVFGAVGVKPTPAKPKREPAPQAEPDTSWRGWRNFVVDRKVAESAEITSFYLKPQDGNPLPAFLPGQFLTIQLNIPDQPRPVIRTYSLSAYAPNPTDYRLSIKREGPPKGQDVPPGVASNFMHNHIQVGAVIPAKPPAGRFFLDVARERPAVLLSNGVGITPMIAMAEAVVAANPERSVWFVHGARDGSFHAFREAVRAIAPANPNFHVHYRYSRPRPEDDGHYDSTGYVDTALVQTVVAPQLQARHGSTDAEYFLCGSPSFMDSLRAGLGEWGVPAEQVYFESFSKPAPKAPAPASSEAAPAATTVETAEVVFAQSGKTATWTPNDGTLLDLAEAQGLDPAWSCRAGVCLTCMCAVQEGTVAYDEPPAGTPDAGTALICVGKPGSKRVVLDV